MKAVIEEKLNEIEIPNNLHERCVAGVMKAKKELKKEEQKVRKEEVKEELKKEQKKELKKELQKEGKEKANIIIIEESKVKENKAEENIIEERKVKEKEIKVRESKVEEKRMKKNWNKKIAATAAVLAVGIVAVGSTTMADGIKGFFKDVTRFDGAVTGTQYLQAADEVKMSVSEALVEGAKTNLSVDLRFLNPNEVPFRELEFVEVDEFEIRDEAGNIIISAEDADAIHSINNGNAKLQLVIEKELVKGENYTLVIENFEGSKKADAPLEIKGAWECEFITH